MTKTINLTQGQVALVDDYKYEELNQWKWYATWSESTQSFYAMRDEWPSEKKIMMHRQIMNTPKGVLCDHKNHNTLDNQERNLRNVSYSQNAMNRGAQPNNQSGEKCISPRGSRYVVQVTKERKKVFYKSFLTLDEAIIARDEALKKYHGEFSYLSK